MTINKELKTIRDYIRYAISSFNQAGLFYGHGTDNSWDEAHALILHTLHLPYDIHSSLFEANLIEQEKAKIIDLINRRIQNRIPLPYLINEIFFAGLPFYVDERVLIPRSPIAELIENYFSPWIEFNQVKNILDMCTGSGCIAVACAKAFPDAQVDASDISKDALVVANINILRHQVEHQVFLHQSDLFATLPQQQYDIIVTNPPYVSQQEIDELPAEYGHEPLLALQAGEKGLDCVIDILKTASIYLRPHGILVVEVGNSEQNLIELFPHVPFTWLEFERGGDGVFLLTADQLHKVSL